MKFNKLFFAAMTLAALAMVGCKKDEKKSEPVTPPAQGGGETEEAPETPNIAAPAAGKTTIAFYAEVCPKGAYLVGNMNDYNINDDALSFTEVAGAEHWYQLTIDYQSDMQAKAIARPSDETVAKSWSYQWGPNFDPEAEKPLVEDESKNNTVILKGDGEWVLENQGEVKLSNVKDGGVVYIWVKAWKSSPIIEAKKLATAWVKSDFYDAELEKYNWGWHEMKKVADGVFEFEGIWGGNGCNIAETEDGADNWYPTDNAAVTLVDEPAKGDKVKVTFTSEKMTVGTLEIKMIEKGKPAAEVPAGTGKFIVTINNRTYADGDKCIFTGNFDEGDKPWGESDRAMTYDAGTQKWSWEGAYPKNFEYKVIYNDKWAAGDNVVFDGKTYEASFDIQD